jgi:phage terminase large subunit-like protein
MIDWPRVLKLIPGYDPIATAGDCRFNPDTALAAVNFFRHHLCHIEGALAGTPFLLEEWQQAIIGNLFGWTRKDAKGRTVRRYREAMIFIPRKNGKTPLAAGIGLYYLFCDPERGQQNYIAASTREQAGLLFRHCKGMVLQQPSLNDRCRIYGGTAPGGQSQSIVRESLGSFLKVISGDSDVGTHGKNLNLAIVDELHEQPNRNLIDALRTSMASANKSQPLMVYTTTSDFDREGSICNEMHEYACKVRDGIVEDQKFLPVIYEATKEEDWTSPEVWARVNPNIGISVSGEYLADECKKAKENPALENLFKRLHLNVRTEQSERLIPMDAWDECGATSVVMPEENEYRACYCGLDLSTVNDLTAFACAFPADDGGYDVSVRVFCPRDTVRKHAIYQQWEREGLIEVTDGLRSTDYRYVRQRINEDAQRYQIQQIGYDPWNASHLAAELGQEDGFQMVEFRQGYLAMNEPTKEVVRLVLDRKLRHGGHKVLRWMAGNMAVKPDPAGNLKPDKQASGGKIDGMVAVIMAIGLAMRNTANESAYSTPGMLYAEQNEEYAESV